MKLYFIKISFLLSISALFFNLNCDMFRTYTKDEFMKLGQKENDEEDKTEVKSGVVSIQEKNSSYIIDSDHTSFDFDIHIPASQRIDALEFRIFNRTDSDFVFTGDPEKIIISGVNPSDFTVYSGSLGTLLRPDDNVTFTIRFNSLSTDGLPRYATVTIPNSTGTPFIFDIQCSAMTVGLYEIKEPGEYIWTAPDFVYSASITLIGGGGGGGGGKSNYYIYDYEDGEDMSMQDIFQAYGSGGGGGGAGQYVNQNYDRNDIEADAVYTVIVGKSGSGGSDPGYYSDGSAGDGQNGQSSKFFKSDYSLTAIGGLKGTGGAIDSSGGLGGTGGDDYINTDEGVSGQIVNGGKGGYNGKSGIAGINHGQNAPSNSGSGGGGGNNNDTLGESGGIGGSGYFKIQWIGFAKP